MNRLQKAAQKKARHDRTIARRLEKKKLRAQSVDPDEEDIDLEAGDSVEPMETPELETDLDETDDVSDEPEEAPRDVDDFAEAKVGVKKDMGYDMAMPMTENPTIGPTSWAELDAQEQAEEDADAMRDISYNVQDLVRNIMNSSVIAPADKATAIQEVGTGLADRVSSALSDAAAGDGGNASMSKSVDLLELEALIATDRRHMPVTERLGDFVTKAKLSYAAKKAKPDSAYALVTTRGGVKVRKYLIHDKAHVRNALARAAQQIKGGGPGAADARAALPKIHAAAKRMGIGMGKELASSIILQKDAKGDWRWVGWPSNNFKDLQGDIISKEAHTEYVAFLDQNPDMAPLFMTWHTPGTEREHRADYWAFEKGFLIMSGVLTEPEAAAIFKAQAATDLGMSLQGFGLRESDDPRVITKYRAFEVSDLPLENAANPFTDFSVISKEVGVDKKEYLATLLGSEEKAEAYMKKAGLKQEALDAAGVESKSTDVKPEVKAPVVKTEAQVTQAVAAAAPTDAKAIIEAVFKELDVEGLNAFVVQAKEAMAKVPVLEGVIKDMQGNQDEALANKITPPATRFAWASKARASESDDTKVEKDDEFVKKTPELGENWLNKVTHTTPINAEAVRA